MSDLTVEQAREKVDDVAYELVSAGVDHASAFDWGSRGNQGRINDAREEHREALDALIAAAEAKGRAEERERGAAEKARYFRWAYRLLVALAKRILKERHNDDGNWPMRMEWHELAPSSCGVFLRAARYEAGVEHEAFLGVVRSGDIEISDIYDGDAPSENPALSSPTTEEAQG